MKYKCMVGNMSLLAFIGGSDENTLYPDCSRFVPEVTPAVKVREGEDIVVRECTPSDSKNDSSSSLFFLPDRSVVYPIILDFVRVHGGVVSHDDLLAELSARDVQVGNLRDYTRTLVKKGYLIRVREGQFIQGGRR